MFARTISIHLKPNTLNDFTTTIEKEVVPVLRKQAGFRDEIVFTGEGTNNVTAISLWDTKEHAEAYATTAYSAVMRSLDKYLGGPSKVTFSSVINSTAHKLTMASVVAA